MVVVSQTHRARTVGLAAAVARLGIPLALAGGLGAFAATVSVANAAECINGYQTLGNQVIVLCGDEAGPSQSTALYPQPAPLSALNEPAATGSIEPRRSGSMMADGFENCQPGMYWTYYLEDGDVILAC
ncbi:MAG: hypothetical protein ACRED5_14545 [Propylenella sp.]